MAGLGKLTVKLMADITGFQKPMQDAEKQASTAASSMSASAGKMAGVGDSLQSVGGKMAGVGAQLTVFSAGAGAGMMYAIKSASDLGEALNKTKVVFGEHADAVIAWSKNSSTAMGMTQKSALDSASNFQNMLLNQGLSMTEARDWSLKLVQRAADIASFHNLSMDEAMVKVNSMMSGEYTPLASIGAKFGVLDAKANAEKKGFGSDKRGTALGQMDLFMGLTDTADNDFQETSNSLANAQRTIGAKFETFAVTIGQVLLPVVEKLLNYGVKILDWLSAMSPQTQAAIAVIGVFVAALGPVLLVLGGVIAALGTVVSALAGMGGVLGVIGAGFATVFSPIGIVIAVVVAAVAALYLAWQTNFAGIRDVVVVVSAQLSAIFMGIAKPLVEIIGPKIAAFVESWKLWWAEVSPVVEFAFQKIFAYIVPIMTSIVNWIETHQKEIRYIFELAWAAISANLTIAWESIKAVISIGVAIIKGILDVGMALLMGDWQGAWDAVLRTFQNIWDSIKKWAGSSITALMAAFSELSPGLRQAAINAMKGFLGGLNDMWQSIKDLASRIANSVADTIKNALAIRSPSRVLMELGKYAGSGFEIGLSQSLPEIQRTIDHRMQIDELGGQSNIGMNAQPRELNININSAGNSALDTEYLAQRVMELFRQKELGYA